MGFYAKKTMMGYREIDGGASDPDAEYYIETVEEHKENLRRIEAAQESVRRANKTADAAIKESQEAAGKADRQIRQYAARAKEDVENRVRKAEREATDSKKKISVLEEKIESLQAQLQSEKYLYRNMQRIMREKANQARGISPKKAHDGYIVLESRQWTERYTEEYWDTEDHKERYGDPENRWYAVKKGYLRRERKTAESWRSTIQTPYDASLPLKQVKNRIEEEIGAVLADINVETRVKTEYNGMYCDFGINDDGYGKNGVYRWKYKANYRSGLWELEIYTTKSLRVPEYRRPAQKNVKNKGKSQKKASGAENIYADDSDLDHTWYPNASDLWGDGV